MGTGAYINSAHFSFSWILLRNWLVFCLICFLNCLLFCMISFSFNCSRFLPEDPCSASTPHSSSILLLFLTVCPNLLFRTVMVRRHCRPLYNFCLNIFSKYPFLCGFCLLFIGHSLLHCLGCQEELMQTEASPCQSQCLGSYHDTRTMAKGWCMFTGVLRPVLVQQ